MVGRTVRLCPAFCNPPNLRSARARGGNRIVPPTEATNLRVFLVRCEAAAHLLECKLFLFRIEVFSSNPQFSEPSSNLFVQRIFRLHRMQGISLDPRFCSLPLRFSWNFHNAVQMHATTVLNPLSK